MDPKPVWTQLWRREKVLASPVIEPQSSNPSLVTASIGTLQKNQHFIKGRCISLPRSSLLSTNKMICERMFVAQR
jgi:hypothetical protein